MITVRCGADKPLFTMIVMIASAAGRTTLRSIATCRVRPSCSMTATSRPLPAARATTGNDSRLAPRSRSACQSICRSSSKPSSAMLPLAATRIVAPFSSRSESISTSTLRVSCSVSASGCRESVVSTGRSSTSMSAAATAPPSAAPAQVSHRVAKRRRRPGRATACGACCWRCRPGERALDETRTRLRRRHPPQRLAQGLEVVLGHVGSCFVLPLHTRSAAIIRSAASSSRSLARARCRRDFSVPSGISIIWASSGRV